MISMLAYSASEREVGALKTQISDIAAYLSDEKWEILCFSVLRELEKFCEQQPLLNLACYDVTEKRSREYLGDFRKKNRDTLLMLIADRNLSPMEYVRPDILASSLILRPFTVEALRSQLKELMREYLSRVQQNDNEDAFILETKEGKTRIPYERIYYMEARDKKIYIRLKSSEYSFYDTIEELEQKLPAGFIRCHRSFLVNQSYIEKIMLSQSEIQLQDGISVPLSRSYKPRFKALR